MTGRADYLLLGDWNAVCEMCGRKRKASMLVKNWQGGWRCPEHNEPRQPQDFVRATPDTQTPPWAQPMPADSFARNFININVSVVTETVSYTAGDGINVVITIQAGVTVTNLVINSSWPAGTTIVINNYGVVSSVTNNSGVILTVNNIGLYPIDPIDYSLTITDNTSDYNVLEQFVAKYTTIPSSVTLRVLVNSGKIVSATNHDTAGMTWGSPWDGTPTFNLINNGYIVGKGGIGAGWVGGNAIAKYADRYLGAFCYRFNRRFDLADLVVRLVGDSDCLSTPGYFCCRVQRMRAGGMPGHTAICWSSCKPFPIPAPGAD